MENLRLAHKGYRYEHELIRPADAKDVRHLVAFEVYYLAGQNRKGVVAAIRPLQEQTYSDGIKFETYEVFSGYSTWAKTLARKSDKAVTEVAEALDSVAPLVIAAFLESPEKGKAVLQQAIQERVK